MATEMQIVLRHNRRYLIVKYQIIGTPFMCAEVYEPSSVMGDHSSLRNEFGDWWGQVGTRRSPWSERLPIGAHRCVVIDRHYQRQYRIARLVLRGHVPEKTTFQGSQGYY